MIDTIIMGRTIVSRLVAGYASIILLLALAWALTSSSAGTLRQHFTHTVNTVDALSRQVILRVKLMDDEETGLRGYLLTGRPVYLEPYTAARQQLPAIKQSTARLAAGVAAARPLLATMSQRATLWEDWASAVVRQAPPRRSAAFLLAMQKGKALFDRYRAAADTVTLYLDQQRSRDLQAGLDALTLTNWLFAAIFAAALALVALIGWLTTRAVTRPLHRLHAATTAIGRGELGCPVEATGTVEFVELAHSMDQMRRQLNTQRALAELMASTLRLEEVYEQFATGIRELVPYDYLSLTVRESEEAVPVVAYATGAGSGADLVGTPLPIQESLTGEAYRTGACVVRADLHALPAEDAFTNAQYQAMIDAGIRAAADIPLLTRGRVVGTLNVGSTQAGLYTTENLGPILALAPLLAAATENARLYRSVDRANNSLATADRAKSQFLAAMSHELRTPLNAIIGFSEVLQDGVFGALNERQQRYVGNVLEAGRHLLGLINDILDISKVEAGRMELHREDIKPDTLLAEAYRVIQPLATRKGIELRLDSCSQSAADGKNGSIGMERPALLHADRARLLQVLYNLLSNAVKFTPAGGTVALSYRTSADSVAIAVSDSGIGIAPEDQARIFEEFQQVDSSATREQQGTGLGLALTRRLVELHGGSIAVRSAPGAGSVFTVTLPRHDPTPAPAHGRRGDVLMVEDQAPAMELFSLYLAEAGYGVQWVDRASEVLERARTMQPMAITLDLRMGDELAWPILQQLKTDAATRDIPVVIVSIVDEQITGFALGAAEYLVKPVSRPDLVAAIQRVAPAGDRPLHILAVDDQPEALELIALALDGTPYTLTRAASGAEALRLLAEHRPDVLLVDLLMEPMSGFDVIAAIADDAALRDLPIIVLTNKDLTSDDITRLNGHILTTLPKHKFDKAQFLSELGHATRRQGGSA